jgi:phosphopantetheine adenylyltransferase
MPFLCFDRYGSVICCIGFNPSKQYDVTAQQRADILKGMVSNISLNNVRVDGEFDSAFAIFDQKTSNENLNLPYTVVYGYIWRHARAQNAKLFFRGIRSWAEDGADELKLLIQNTYGPLLLGRIWPINTVFLEGDPRYRGVSSTLVRGLCGKIKRDEDKDSAMEELKQLVPESVLDEIVEAYGT